eukprot:3997191-Pyramimonas_sp.AAC.1
MRPQEAPRGSPEAPKRPPRDAQEAPRGSKRFPRGPPRSLNDSHQDVGPQRLTPRRARTTASAHLRF